MTDIRIIGVGTMGEGIASRLSLEGHHLSFYDTNQKKAQEVAQSLKGKVVATPFENVSPKTVIILAIKPQDFPSFVQEAKKGPLPSFHLLVTLLTGVPISSFKEHFHTCPILRMMPNIAIRYGKGVIALAATEELQPFQQELSALFSPLGFVTWIPEKQFNAMTSLIGSGPGFISVLIESMVDAAIAMGFPAHEALTLIKQMLTGTLVCLEETKQHPGAMKWQVASPGGTTIEGLRILEEKNVRSGVIEAFLAAYRRAQELSHS